MRITCCFLLLTALPLAAQTDQYEGFAGFWLENDRAEAFAITAPYPRVLAFRLKGGENPLHVSREYEYIGVRSWFFEPTQIPASGLPALQPATAEMTGARSVRLTAAPDDSSGLQLIMEVALDSERPVLQIRHGFKNMRTEKRRIACWALNVDPPRCGRRRRTLAQHGPPQLAVLAEHRPQRNRHPSRPPRPRARLSDRAAKRLAQGRHQ